MKDLAQHSTTRLDGSIEWFQLDTNDNCVFTSPSSWLPSSFSTTDLVPSGRLLLPTLHQFWMTLLHHTMMLIYYRCCIPLSQLCFVPQISKPTIAWLMSLAYRDIIHPTPIHCCTSFGYHSALKFLVSFLITIQMKSTVYFYNCSKGKIMRRAGRKKMTEPKGTGMM